jgi:UDPglucose 6-dehydrogenase
MPNVKQIYGDKIAFSENQYAALEGADFLVIATEWNVFRSPDFDKIKTLLKSKIIFDGRNLYDLNEMKDLGFYYYSVGRKTII